MSRVETMELRPDELVPATAALVAAGGRMQMMYAWKPKAGDIELRYVARRPGEATFLIWRVTPHGPVPSIARISPLIGWYERETTDLFGLSFADHPEPNRLVLHSGAHPVLPPLDPAYPPDTPMRYEESDGEALEVVGPDVQQLPFGPIRADVVESVELLFYYVGEHILHFYPRLFFKHRGMEKRFEGLAPDAGVVLAERVSGVGTFAHALAYCQAVERASGAEVPPRALMLRSLLAELERIYNHLHYLGHLADTTTLKVGNAEGKLLEERAKQINARLTGSRFLRSLLTPGGLRRDLDPKPWLGEALEALRRQVARYTRMLEATNSHLDRLITTGILAKDVAFDQGATGPVERASGVDHDLRRDHPYAGYAGLEFAVPVQEAGDAHAREQVRIAELIESIAMIQRILALLPDGPVAADLDAPPAGAEALGWAESPRGSLFYAVHFTAAGRLARVKIKSPSYSNWRAFAFTVHDSNMMDYAINEASFGMTVAGCDR